MKEDTRKKDTPVWLFPFILMFGGGMLVSTPCIIKNLFGWLCGAIGVGFCISAMLLMCWEMRHWEFKVKRR